MLEGITVLAESTVDCAKPFSNWWLAIAIIIACIPIGCFIICLVKESLRCAPNFAALVVSFFIAVFFIYEFVNYNNFVKTLEPKTEYKVLISEDVKMKEFYEQYEVVDTDGNIFIITEKVSETNED